MGRIRQYTTPGDPRTKSESPSRDRYSAFDQLDGQHDWQDVMPEGCVLYPVRQLRQGEVTYFNFALAKEMGLIPQNHPHVLNKELESKILKTFSIRIINEYDQNQNVKFMPSLVKKHPYMATRYLQLQHKNKQGKTSGDGRSIWNGQIQHNDIVWDISSRGTGVTRLAPGAAESGKPLRSGNTKYGYGCGLADLDELIAAAIMAEIFHNNNINTERVLTVIDLGHGNGIGVRAGKNLFRPAHLFMYLKQGQIEPLRRATDYLIQRQYQNKEWSFNINSRKKYDLMLQEISENFAHFAAQLDRHYIFAWLDWDGDNVLANAGIIDYGSIRQFGLRHDEYRYDDVDRMSTTLQEQKKKARELVQVFAQLTDYLKTGKKKPLGSFKNHWSVQSYDKHLRYYLLDQFLLQVGLSRRQREAVLSENVQLIEKFYSVFSAMERKKTKKRAQKVSDGVNRPAVFNMRFLLHELPLHYLHALEAGEVAHIPTRQFFELILAESARGRDRKLTPSTRTKITRLQKHYWQVLKHLAGDAENLPKLIEQIYKRALHVNRPDRLTGDGLLNVVDELIKFKNKSNNKSPLQDAIEQLIAAQSATSTKSNDEEGPRLHARHRTQSLFETMLSLVDGYKESI